MKIVALGDTNVGKTSFILNYKECLYPKGNEHSPTIGVDFYQTDIKIDGEKINMVIWDTAGHEKYRAMIPIHCRDADGFLVFFDISSIKSFKNSKHWIEFVYINSLKHNPIILLIGNKCDLNKAKRRVVKRKDAERSAKQNNIYKYIETSTTFGDNVEEAFKTIAKACLNQNSHSTLLGHNDAIPTVN